MNKLNSARVMLVLSAIGSVTGIVGGHYVCALWAMTAFLGWAAYHRLLLVLKQLHDNLNQRSAKEPFK